MGGVRDEAGAEFELAFQPAEEVVHRNDERQHLARHPGGRDRRGPVAERRQFRGEAIERPHRPRYDPAYDEQGNRHGGQDRQNGLERSDGDQLAPHLHALRADHRSLGPDLGVDPPFLAARHHGVEARHGRAHEVRLALVLRRGPDGGDEDVFRHHPPALGARRLDRVDVLGNLAELVVERPVDHPAIDEEGSRSHRKARRAQDGEETEEKTGTKRPHRGAFGIVQPMPRRLRMTSLSKRFRT